MKQKRTTDISFTTLGLELALPIFGGVLFGYHLDQVTLRHYLFTLVFLAIGLVVGYYNLFKVIQLEIFRLKQKRNDTGDETS
jgi:F0F1-type ATP synthase assembly protein I